jgi:hypothetical protein
MRHNLRLGKPNIVCAVSAFVCEGTENHSFRELQTFPLWRPQLRLRMGGPSKWILARELLVLKSSRLPLGYGSSMIARPTQRRRLCRLSEPPGAKSTRLTFWFVWLFALAHLAAHAQEAKPDQSSEPTSAHAVELGARTTDGTPSGDPVSICQLVEAAAAANRLPFEFSHA